MIPNLIGHRLSWSTYDDGKLIKPIITTKIRRRGWRTSSDTLRNPVELTPPTMSTVYIRQWRTHNPEKNIPNLSFMNVYARSLLSPTTPIEYS